MALCVGVWGLGLGFAQTDRPGDAVFVEAFLLLESPTFDSQSRNLRIRLESIDT